MDEQEHEVTMYPTDRKDLYDASRSCGWRAFKSTPDLIGRHKLAREQEAANARRTLSAPS